ncbi:hypothetical protein BgramDRAFT_4018 [Paraburkholderia graminis C4D1M]|uniref:Uncharacterized protein n=1 Tax=Paraburkholderia graminis (strain ATCC 700544 / DSM 17151 / LMG 18924 / NCIMB 13744 / C4D1M) TaxID=396598 RepID=B1G3S4_PARG4|nr:hypothetical protein BgramDRAFT_4018 [Paraburkholderia graminis C4D1M]
MTRRSKSCGLSACCGRGWMNVQSSRVNWRRFGLRIARSATSSSCSPNCREVARRKRMHLPATDSCAVTRRRTTRADSPLLLHVEKESLNSKNGWCLSLTSGIASGRAIVCAAPAPGVSAEACMLARYSSAVIVDANRRFTLRFTGAPETGFSARIGAFTGRRKLRRAPGSAVRAGLLEGHS